MKPGDKLLTVNGESVLGYSLEKVEYAEDKQNQPCPVAVVDIVLLQK